MALHLRLKPHYHHSPLPTLRLLSSSPLPPPPPPPPSDESTPESQSQSNVSSYFRDIKQRLGSPPSPSHGIPTDPLPPPSFFRPQSQKPAASLEEIRKSLANFRLNSPPSSSSPPSSFSPPKFQDILKSNLQNNPSGSGSPLSFDSIRQNLRQSRSSNDSFFNLKSLQETIRNQGPQPGAPRAPSLIGSDSHLREGIFGREARERDGEEGEKESNKFAHFTKEYTHQELGEKLARLRPEEGEKTKEGFSLNELNQRLVKLRKLEVEEAKLNDSPFSFIKETLYNIQNQTDAQRRQQRMPILTSLGGLVTPTYMLKEPKEQLLEKYFHPDHMSSAEKMKLELKKVRDEFKMSESDCGSARVQVAQLTTKIKHLSTVLHKKDKHSKKGLQEMVQRRKKLLKYLRRTDWDSYCLVLSKLGLRDVPEYKAPDYKAFHQIKPKSKSKSKKSKGRTKMKA